MVPLLSTEPAMMTLPLPAWRKPEAKGLGLFGSVAGELLSASFPADTTTTTPALAARPIAARNALSGDDPPSERLMTLAPFTTARSTPAVIALSKKLQPAAVAQEPGASARIIRIFAS